SPLMLNTTMRRALRSTSLRLPAGKSRKGAMTCLAMRSLAHRRREPAVGRERVVETNLAVQLFRNAGRHRLVAVELPVREIGRVKQHVVGLQMIDEARDLDRVVGA